jgi:hypothetical protein
VKRTALQRRIDALEKYYKGMLSHRVRAKRRKTRPARAAVLVFALWLLLGCTISARAYTDEQLVNAIGRAENSARYPYGIRSIDTRGNKEYARKICLRSVRNAKRRWSAAGSKGDFVSFMGRRFSPPAINPNWVRLVNYFLKKGAGR